MQHLSRCLQTSVAPLRLPHQWSQARSYGTGSVGTAITDSTWQSVVIDGSNDKPVIVDFTASWCGPCKVLGPLLEKTVKADGNVTLATYDIDESSEKSEEYAISAVPSVYAFSRGRKVAEFKGSIPEQQLQEFVLQVRNLHEGGEE